MTLVLAPALGLDSLGALFVLRLQLRQPAPGLGVDGAGLALPGPIERLAALLRLHRGRNGLHLRFLRDRPLDQREGALGRHRHHLAVVLALGHRSEPLAHGDFRVLAHVREQVVAQRDFRDFLVVQGLSGAAQDLHGRFRKRHVRLRGSAVGTGWRLPFRRSKKVVSAY